MDEFEKFLAEQFQFSLMDESFRVVRGFRVADEDVRLHQDVRTPRNSFVQLNIAVNCPQDAQLLLEERISFVNLDPNRFMIVRAAMEIEGLEGKLHLIDTLMDDDGLQRGDVVLEQPYMNVHPWQVNQITALIPVPETVAPGEYKGRIRFYAHSMFYDEKLARELTFTIKVEETVLPKPQDGKFYLNLWQHVYNIARKHEVRPFTPEHLEALRPYAKALGELGNKAVTVLLSDIPWAGQRCWTELYNPSDLFEYNYVRIRRKANGEFVYDFSFAEQYIALMKEYGATDVMFTGIYGLWEDAKIGFGVIVEDWADTIRLSYVDEKDGCIRFMRKRDEVVAYLRAVYQWIKDQNLLSTSYLMGDEVDLPGKTEGWTAVLETLKEELPEIRRDWDMLPHVLMSDTYKDERVDIYTPQIDGIPMEEPEVWQSAMDRVSAGGKKLWSVCCWPPVMNSFLYTNLNEVRLHGLITEHVKLDGFLRWNFTVWPDDPRRDLRFFAPGWPAGDTCFVYPGKGGQCLLSLRYLALKRGIEDFELCQLVKEKCANADEVINKAMACVLPEMDVRKWNFADYHGRTKYLSHNNQDYVNARNILLDALKEV